MTKELYKENESEPKDAELEDAQREADDAIVAMLEEARIPFRVSRSSAGADFTCSRDHVAHHFWIVARRCDVRDAELFPRHGEIYFRLWIGQDWDRASTDDEFQRAHELSKMPEAHGTPAFDAARHCSYEIMLDNARYWLVEWSDMLPIQPHSPPHWHASVEARVTKALRTDHYVDFVASATKQRSTWMVGNGPDQRSFGIETADTSVRPVVEGGFPGRGETFFRVRLGEGIDDHELLTLPCDHEFAVGNAILWLVDRVPVSAIRHKRLRRDAWLDSSEVG